MLASCSKAREEEGAIPEEELVPRKDIVLTRAQADFVKDNNKFALDLFLRTASEAKGESVVISPLSVTFAMGMVDNGARGNTLAQINEVLGFSGSVDELNAFCKTMLEQSAQVDPSTKIEIANAAVVNKIGKSLKQDFTRAVESNYGATVGYMDFSKEDVAGYINKWCSDKTHEMIPKLLEEPVSPLDYAHFLNAIYFKGIWSSQFKKSNSAQEKFTLENGSSVKVNMMHQNGKFSGAVVTGLCKAVCLPYGNQAYRMILILPEEGLKLDGLKKSFDLDLWNTVNYALDSREVDVKLPSFESEFKIEFSDILQAMGITDAFDGSRADFSGMTEESVRIDKVLHKAKIKVDEQGSEAAAVTDVTIRKNSATPAGPMDFHADRPFLYAITEVSTGAIFFLGQYMGK